MDRLRERWGRGEPAINSWVLQADPATPRALADAGFDSVTVDLQHGRATEAGLVEIAAAVEGAGAVPLVRLRWNSPDEVMRVLDLGIRGVFAPMVGDADEAARLAAAAHYPPDGVRSYGPIAGAFGEGRDHVREANDRVFVFAMIETADGLRNVDAIATTSGVDGLYVGPADLSLSLGVARFADLSDARLVEALDVVVASARAAGIVAGVHAPSSDRSVEMLERGFTFVTPIVDDDAVADRAAETLDAVRRR